MAETPFSQNEKTWRLIDVLQEAAAFLSAHGVKNARLNAERLLAAVLDCTRVDLYLAFDRPLSGNEREQFKILLRRRALHEPLQYILGVTEFMSFPFRVTPDVLIPRPETEILVEKVIEEVKNIPYARIIDIGSGSGAIGISLAKILSGVEVVCADVDLKALEVSRKNAERNEVLDRIRFVCSDLSNPLFSKSTDAPFPFVVSNPPYVTEREWEKLPIEIRDHEPKRALVAGEDGLDCYRMIVSKTEELICPGGKLFLEVGAGQSRPVSELLSRSGFTQIQIHQDLNGIERIVRAERKPGEIK